MINFLGSTTHKLDSIKTYFFIIRHIKRRSQTFKAKKFSFFWTRKKLEEKNTKYESIFIAKIFIYANKKKIYEFFFCCIWRSEQNVSCFSFSNFSSFLTTFLHLILSSLFGATHEFFYETNFAFFHLKSAEENTKKSRLVAFDFWPFRWICCVSFSVLIFEFTWR